MEKYSYLTSLGLLRGFNFFFFSCLGCLHPVSILFFLVLALSPSRGLCLCLLYAFILFSGKKWVSIT